MHPANAKNNTKVFFPAIVFSLLIPRYGTCPVVGVLYAGPNEALPLGGKLIQIRGACFEPDAQIVCQFDSVTSPGQLISTSANNIALCLVPQVLKVGRINFWLSADGGVTFPYTGFFNLGMHYIL